MPGIKPRWARPSPYHLHDLKLMLFIFAGALAIGGLAYWLQNVQTILPSEQTQIRQLTERVKVLEARP